MTKRMLSVPPDEFDAVVAQIEAIKGIPGWEQGEIGPAVWTERWSNGVPLKDGNIAIEIDDHIESELGRRVKTNHKPRDIQMAEFKRVRHPEDAEHEELDEEVGDVLVDDADSDAEEVTRGRSDR